jgi:hypothetical protein
MHQEDMNLKEKEEVTDGCDNCIIQIFIIFALHPILLT